MAPLGRLLLTAADIFDLQSLGRPVLKDAPFDEDYFDSLADFDPNGAGTLNQPAKFHRIIDPRKWQGLPIPVRNWIVPDYIPDLSVTLLSGDGGQGKSLLALQLAIARADS